MKARLPQGYGGGMGNMNALARQAQKMQEDMAKLTEELNQTDYSAAAGGGAVEAVVSGELVVKSITIQPEVVDPEDVDMLSDLVMAAVNQAIRKANEDKEAKMGQITGGMNIPGLL